MIALFRREKFQATHETISIKMCFLDHNAIENSDVLG